MKDFISYVRSVVGSKEARQFQKAMEATHKEFHDRVIAPQCYSPDENLHLGIATDQFLPGRNHRLAALLVEHPKAAKAATFFTNPLSIPPDPEVVAGKEVWVAPMARVVWGHHQVFTFEFDNADLEFFRTQLSWCRGKNGKPLDSSIGKLFLHCSQWIDFSGISVAYSGNKSLHIHIVFTTQQAIALGVTGDIRQGHKQQWLRLRPDVLQVLNPGMGPDVSLAHPEQFRRLPNGVRELQKCNILGMPAGSLVPQVTLWERFRDRAAKGATTSFFDPMLFAPAPKNSTRARLTSHVTYQPADAELDFCRAKMRRHFVNASFPEFYDFATQGGKVCAHFRNHEGDHKPSTVMTADFATLHVQGANPLRINSHTAPRLPKPLGQMFSDWCAEYQAINGRDRTKIEHDFAMTVHDRASARVEMAKLLLQTIRDERRALICAPEGISKTTGLFTQHQRIDHWLKAQEQGLVMYAFADYNAAADKAAEFNAHHAMGSYKAVVWPSFDRAYQDACDELRMKRLDSMAIAAMGHTSLWAAIEDLQPQVIDVFQQRHAQLWADVGSATAVIFTVHGVAHNWHLSSKSRLMWSPSFWTFRARTDQGKICQRETALSLLIHDEIKAENLVALYPAWKVLWVDDLITSDPNDWSSSSTPIRRHRAFQAFRASNPPAGPVTFEEVQDIAGLQGREWDQIVTEDSGEYGHLKSCYAGAVGQEWYVTERDWPVLSATRILALTTESVPTHIACRSFHDWTVYDLDTPQIKPDIVTVHAQRGVTGDNLPKLCADWRKSHPGMWIISNKVKHLPDTMTHAAARGSNRLIGKDIMQTMTFVTPAEFEKLEALNAWTGLDCLIRHRHIDEFNQTAGRNLGFRNAGSARHFLLVNAALFSLLAGAPIARARYEMQVLPTRHQQRKARQLRAAITSSPTLQQPLEVCPANDAAEPGSEAAQGLNNRQHQLPAGLRTQDRRRSGPSRTDPHSSRCGARNPTRSVHERHKVGT